ncbi:MAG: pyruvate kinase [Planctomycetota bacterium]|nr:MAG: pyruvate kinase [Planctomycetota bacterium]
MSGSDSVSVSPGGGASTAGRVAGQAKTKIVATVGPSCRPRTVLRKLVVAGVDVFRLNFAHGRHEWLAGVVADIRGVAEELGVPVGILGDLSGPKIRLGDLPGDELVCNEGQTVRFVRQTVARSSPPATVADVPGDSQPVELTSTYDRLVDDLQVGDRVLLADGTVALRVVEKDPGGAWAECIVEHPGRIRSRQGINLPGVSLSTPSLTEKDLRDLQWALEQRLDYVGLSFVRSAEDVRRLESLIASQTPARPQIVAKIEKCEALDDLDAIIRSSDCVMVARGDLGVEADITRVPVLQKQIIRACNRQRVPVITATQMLDSMQYSELPTRAEATDVANAVLDGTDAMMLSAETAIGQFPIQAVEMMNRIACEAEKLQESVENDQRPRAGLRHRALEVTEAVIAGAGDTAMQLNADLIVVVTRTGRSALAMAERRLPVPTLALTERPETARRMCLYWGVFPVVAPVSQMGSEELVRFIVDWGRRTGTLRSGSRFVVVFGTQWSAHGHDIMLVHEVP